MVRKLTLILAAVAAGLVLVKLVRTGEAYETVYTTVTIVGLVLSIFYLSTWGFYALKAWRNGRLRFASITVLEFVIIPILAIPSFGLALYNIVTIGFAVVPDPSIRASRLTGLVTLLLVMVLRNLNWVLRWRDKHGTSTSPQEAISDSNPV